MKHFLCSMALAVFVFTTNSAVAPDWNKAIDVVEAASNEYLEYARAVGGTSWAGSMYNGYEFDRHKCAILGRMLGLEEAIIDLETMPYPPMDATSDPHDLLVFSISLENWVIAAREALEMDEARRRNLWNLDCVDHLGIPTEYYLANAEPDAEFKAENGTLTVYGDIDFGFFERLKIALDNSEGIEAVALGSGGGSVTDALQAGYEIRIRGLSTTIYSNCLSACPLVFMGGTNRSIWSTPSRLGFHQIYLDDGTPIAANDEIYSLVETFLELMGIDAGTVIRWMMAAPPTGMYFPEVKELCDPQVATWVQRVCTSADSAN